MENNTKNGNWLQTYLGYQFFPGNPQAKDIFIEDIAHSLSNQCRFAGHVLEFYSVAEHSVRVSLACDPDDALWGLLHDASEAYLVDIPRPIKRMESMRGYKILENGVMAVVCERFGLLSQMPVSVNLADNVLLATEKRDLMRLGLGPWEKLPDPLLEIIKPLPPGEAKKWFIYRFDELTGGL